MPRSSPRFKICFNGSPCGVRRALSQIRDELEAAGATSDQKGRIETVMAEVLNNVVEHALADQTNSLVEAHGFRQQPNWCFKVFDAGHPLPQKRLPDQGFPAVDTNLEDLPEGGFGWAMVHMLTNDISYCRLPGRNCLEFSVPDH